jgi:uncharacterized LabA/DUF88 family protein
MKETLVFIDAGFLSKVNKNIRTGTYFNKINFATTISKNENFFMKKLYYYDAPPHSSNYKLVEKYNNFKNKLTQNKKVILREGRLQKLVIKSKCEKCYTEILKTKYQQKGVDTLLTMDLNNFQEKYKKIKTIILITSDSDFIPIIKHLKSKNIKIILYTFYTKDRKSEVSNKSPKLVKAVDDFKLIKKEFFEK